MRCHFTLLLDLKYLIFVTLQQYLQVRKSVPPTLRPSVQMKECTPHSFSPLYRWEGRVYYTLFPLQYGGDLKMYPTLFFPTVKMGRKSVPPTLFFYNGEKECGVHFHISTLLKGKKYMYPLYSSPRHRGEIFKE